MLCEGLFKIFWQHLRLIMLTVGFSFSFSLFCARGKVCLKIIESTFCLKKAKKKKTTHNAKYYISFCNFRVIIFFITILMSFSLSILPFSRPLGGTQEF